MYSVIYYINYTFDYAEHGKFKKDYLEKGATLKKAGNNWFAIMVKLY